MAKEKRGNGAFLGKLQSNKENVATCPYYFHLRPFSSNDFCDNLRLKAFCTLK